MNMKKVLMGTMTKRIEAGRLKPATKRIEPETEKRDGKWKNESKLKQSGFSRSSYEKTPFEKARFYKTNRA